MTNHIVDRIFVIDLDGNPVNVMDLKLDHFSEIANRYRWVSSAAQFHGWSVRPGEENRENPEAHDAERLADFLHALEDKLRQKTKE